MNDAIKDFLAPQMNETREIVRGLRGILSIFELAEKFDPDQKLFSYSRAENAEAAIVFIVVHEIYVEIGFKDGAQFFPKRMSSNLYSWVYWLYPIVWRLNLRLPTDHAVFRRNHNLLENLVASKAALILEGKEAVFRYVRFRTFDDFYRHVGTVKQLVMEAIRVSSESNSTL